MTYVKVVLFWGLLGVYTATPQLIFKEAGKPYNFEYGIRDDVEGLDYGQNEVSDGEVVQGSYSVLLPDGRIQIVRYTADHVNGFVADVEYIGEAQYARVSGPPVTFRPQVPVSSLPARQLGFRRPQVSAVDLPLVEPVQVRPAYRAQVRPAYRAQSRYAVPLLPRTLIRPQRSYEEIPEKILTPPAKDFIKPQAEKTINQQRASYRIQRSYNVAEDESVFDTNTDNDAVGLTSNNIQFRRSHQLPLFGSNSEQDPITTV